jgi:hypothetical protein
MAITSQKVTKTTFDIATVDTVEEARTVYQAILKGEITPKNKRDAANGLVEAFFVSHLRNVPKDRLGTVIRQLQNTFPAYDALNRALRRVKKFRGKNPAWRGVTIAA